MKFHVLKVGQVEGIACRNPNLFGIHGPASMRVVAKEKSLSLATAIVKTSQQA
jgi:hypothetical protein